MQRTVMWAAAAWLLAAGMAHAQSTALSVRLRADLVVRVTAEGEGREPIGPEHPLPLVGERLRAVIDAQHATTTLVQVFRNTTGSTLEGRYILRPSLDARVSGFAYYIGERRIEGEVIERNAARRVYDAVTSERRDPAILEQTADGELTFRVFPIQPREDKRIEMTFAEWLERRGASVSYRVPLGPEADAEIVLRDPRARDFRSPTHELDVEPLPGGGARIRTRRLVDPRGELVLRWRIDEPAWQPAVYLHRDEGHDGYFLLALAAPDGAGDLVAPKDVTLVLDRSGSMGGAAIEHARAAAADVIRRLGMHDRLNVIAFDDDVEPLYARPREADLRTRTDALGFVERLLPGGGTDIAFALSSALDRQNGEATEETSSEGRPRVVILLTDGQSAAEPVLRLADRDARDVRVFTVGLGTGVNRALLSRLAAVKRGSFTYIDHASAVEREVGHLYGQIAQPLLVDVSVDVEGAVASRTYPRSLPDVFVGDELVVAGRLRGDGPVRFVVRGYLGGRPVEMRAAAQLRERARKPWVGRRWAISRVDHLLEDMQLEGERPELRDEVVSLALAYDFVTPYTAFLAIPKDEATGEAARMLGEARAQRAAAQARHADGAALGADEDMGLDAEMEEYDDRMASPSYAGAAPDVSSAGCASCAVGAPLPAPRSGWLLLGSAAALAVMQRRRTRNGR